MMFKKMTIRMDRHFFHKNRFVFLRDQIEEVTAL